MYLNLKRTKFIGFHLVFFLTLQYFLGLRCLSLTISLDISSLSFDPFASTLPLHTSA